MTDDLDLFRAIREKANSGLYRYKSKKEINKLYQGAYRQVRQPLNESEFFKILLVLTDAEGSNHNYTDPTPSILAFYSKQRAFFPYPLKYIGGKMILNIKDKEIPLGARILSINGVSDTLLMRSLYKYVPTDGYNLTQKWSSSVNGGFGTRYLIEYGLHNAFDVIYTSPNSSDVKSVTLASVTQAERANNLKNRHSATTDSLIDANVNPKYSFRQLNATTGLLNFRIFTMASNADDPAFSRFRQFLDSTFRVLTTQKINNLIIDIRNNPGGNDPTYEEVFSHFTQQPFYEHKRAYTLFRDIPFKPYFYGTSTNQRIDSTNLSEFQRFLNKFLTKEKNGKFYEVHNPVYTPRSPHFTGNVYVLIDENVASAASHLASLIRAYSTAILVGVETSGGYYGHNGHIPFVYELPNSKIKTKFSVVYVDQDAPPKASQPVGRGIIPDHEVWMSFDDFMQQRDTQMDYVLKLIEKQH